MFTFTRYSQQDPGWKDQPLGFDPAATIKSLGCLLTDLAMAATGFGYNETPATLNQKLKALGPGVGFSGKLVYPAALPRVLPGVIFREFLDCPDTPAPMDRIDTALDAGWPVIVQVDYSPAAGLQSHWILLYARQGTDYLFQDPWPFPPDPGAAKLSGSRFAFAGDPAKVITAVIWLEGPRPAVNKPVGAVSLYATSDGLAVRSAPLVDPANLLTRVGLLSELYSLEPTADTLHKVGVANQWLHVQTPDGIQGFAAAWYLNIRPEVPGQTPDAPLSPDGKLWVYAAADQLALRSQPNVDPTTLLKRLAVNTALLVLEPSANAAAKVGMVDAWLQVQDPDGVQGSVAAWYVSLTAPTGLGPANIPVPVAAPAALVVVTTVPALALRSQPSIAPDTLIKRVPFGAELVVTGSAAAALKKIGMNDQWLKVKDADGTAGYIAAWFVKQRE